MKADFFNVDSTINDQRFYLRQQGVPEVIAQTGSLFFIMSLRILRGSFPLPPTPQPIIGYRKYF